jgi:pimeloyl-ACP methyl ester carboxylesterase
MRFMFQVAVDELRNPKGRNLEAYFRAMGIPKPGTDEILKIPPVIVTAIMRLKAFGEWLRPTRPYDAPLLPFSMRAGFKFLSEYDVDFSAATLDGRLGAGFDPDATLRSIACPVLYLHANWSRDPKWGLLGASDDRDVERVKTLVKDLRVVRVDSPHEVHMSEPQRYVREVTSFLDSLPR